MNSIRFSILDIFNNHQKYFWEDKGNQKLKPIKIVNNYDWYKDMKIIDFLNGVGKHFRLGNII